MWFTFNLERWTWLSKSIFIPSDPYGRMSSKTIFCTGSGFPRSWYCIILVYGCLIIFFAKLKRIIKQLGKFSNLLNQRSNLALTHFLMTNKMRGIVLSNFHWLEHLLEIFKEVVFLWLKSLLIYAQNFYYYDDNVCSFETAGWTDRIYLSIAFPYALRNNLYLTEQSGKSILYCQSAEISRW